MPKLKINPSNRGWVGKTLEKRTSSSYYPLLIERCESRGKLGEELQRNPSSRSLPNPSPLISLCMYLLLLLDPIPFCFEITPFLYLEMWAHQWPRKLGFFFKFPYWKGNLASPQGRWLHSGEPIAFDFRISGLLW